MLGFAVARVAGVTLILFAVAWQVREVTSFEKSFLPREDIAAARKYLLEHDTRNIVFTNGLVDSPQRYFLERHHLAVDNDHHRTHPAWQHPTLRAHDPRVLRARVERAP